MTAVLGQLTLMICLTDNLNAPRGRRFFRRNRSPSTRLILHQKRARRQSEHVNGAADTTVMQVPPPAYSTDPIIC